MQPPALSLRAHQPRKRQLPDQQAGAALVLADLAQRDRAGPEAVRLLCGRDGQRAAACQHLTTMRAALPARHAVLQPMRCTAVLHPSWVLARPGGGAVDGARRSPHSLAAAAAAFSGDLPFLAGVFSPGRLPAPCRGRSVHFEGARPATPPVPTDRVWQACMTHRPPGLTGRACLVLAMGCSCLGSRSLLPTSAPALAGRGQRGAIGPSHRQHPQHAAAACLDVARSRLVPAHLSPLTFAS